MKTIILILAAGVLLASCGKAAKPAATPDARAADSVKAYLKTHLDDPSSYDPGKFDKLEKNFSSYKNDDNYYTYSNWIARSKEQSDKKDSAAVYRRRKSSGFYDRLFQSGMKKMDSLKKNYKPSFMGYLITHWYQAKNSAGSVVPHQTVFTLDTAFSVLKADESK
ncbi:MAG TPA: hypothetical protein VHB54_20740 [Mucilaginibacter sp.]|nr:hypothetical protein [Mucilaginibacter sp.]